MEIGPKRKRTSGTNEREANSIVGFLVSRRFTGSAQLFDRSRSVANGDGRLQCLDESIDRFRLVFGQSTFSTEIELVHPLGLKFRSMFDTSTRRV